MKDANTAITIPAAALITKAEPSITSLCEDRFKISLVIKLFNPRVMKGETIAITAISKLSLPNSSGSRYLASARVTRNEIAMDARFSKASQKVLSVGLNNLENFLLAICVASLKKTALSSNYVTRSCQKHDRTNLP